jgi:hypothetical protein
MTHTLTVHKYEASDPRLGRHVHHDSRSLDYLFLPPDATPKKKSVTWGSKAPALNQGQVGSCTGNAMTNFLNSIFADVIRTFQKRNFLTEADALTFYHWATVEDTYKGTYPPTDTGSDGLSVCKGAQHLGWLGSYNHLVSFSSVQAAVENTPAIQGTVWTNKMFKPVNGLVKVGKITDSTIAGGHEYHLCGIDWTNDLMIYRNSWGDVADWPGCKPGGFFAMTFKDVQNLLAEQGDVTVPVGRTATLK